VRSDKERLRLLVAGYDTTLTTVFCSGLAWNKNGIGFVARLEFVSAAKMKRMVPVSESPKYPDISDLIARKAKGRVNIKQLSFGEKIELMEELRRRLAPIKALREARKHSRQTS
jgi:hypothetical protein